MRSQKKKKPTLKSLRTALEDIAGYVLPVYTHNEADKCVPFLYANALRDMAKEALEPSDD